MRELTFKWGTAPIRLDADSGRTRVGKGAIRGRLRDVLGKFTSDVQTLSFYQTTVSNRNHTSDMFSGLKFLIGIDLQGLYTRNMTSMKYMFAEDPMLTSVKMTASFKTNRVTDMSEMFEGDRALSEVDLNKNMDISHLKRLDRMFAFDYNLKVIKNRKRLYQNKHMKRNDIFLQCNKLPVHQRALIQHKHERQTILANKGKKASKKTKVSKHPNAKAEYLKQKHLLTKLNRSTKQSIKKLNDTYLHQLNSLHNKIATIQKAIKNIKKITNHYIKRTQNYSDVREMQIKLKMYKSLADYYKGKSEK